MAIKDTLPPIKPTLLLDFANTKALDPRITFTRASTATFYDGKTTAKAEENLFYPSVNIGTPYQNPANALTNNVGTAPDGTPTASLLVPTSAAVRHYCSSPLGPAAPAGTVMTGSVHVKAAGYGFAFLILAGASGTGGSRYGVTVNLSTGAVGGYSAASNVSGQSVVVTNVGGGWFRVALTATLSIAPTQSAVYVHSMPTDGATYQNGGDFLPVYSGNGVDGAYFWGFQLEQRDTVTAYTPTTTAPITNYIPALQTAPAGVPRFDHNPVTGESLGLLIEEGRTNLLTYSEDLTNTAWVKTTGTTVVQNSSTAPDGKLTADTINYDGTGVSGNYRIYFGGAGTAVNGTSYTSSIWLRANTATTVILYGNAVAGGFVTCNLTTQWQRFTTTGVGNGLSGLQLLIYSNAGSNAAFSIQAWGAQLEEGAFPTSYIKTEASQVTRAADSDSMTGGNFSAWFNQAEGTLVADVAFSSSANTTFGAVSLNSGSSANSISLVGYGGTPRLLVIKDASTQAELTAGPSINGASARLVGAYAANDFAYSRNGSAAASDISGGVPSVSALNIGSLVGVSNALNGTIKRLAYYPRRLTNAQLQSLTA